MSYKEKLGKFHSKAYGGFTPEELQTFGVKDKGGEFIRRTPSFDGETFDSFLKAAKKPADENTQARGAMTEQYLKNSAFFNDDPDFIYRFYDDPKKAKILDTFTKAGISEEQLPGLARQAGVKNLNKAKEARKMLQQHLANQGVRSPKDDTDKVKPKREPFTYTQDPNRDNPAVSTKTSQAQERLSQPLVSLYDEQQTVNDNPVKPAQFRDDYIKRNFMSTGRSRPNRMLAMYNAMNEVA